MRSRDSWTMRPNRTAPKAPSYRNTSVTELGRRPISSISTMHYVNQAVSAERERCAEIAGAASNANSSTFEYRRIRYMDDNL